MLDTLAAALAAVGRCREAAATEEHAADMAVAKGSAPSAPSTPRA